MGEHPNVEAARASLEAFLKGDMETMAAGIAEDAVWHLPGKNRWSGDRVGREAIMGRFQEMAEAGISSRLDEIHDVVGNDEHVLAMVRFTLTAPAGTTTQTSVWVMHVKDGKATEFWPRNEDQDELDRLLS